MCTTCILVMDIPHTHRFVVPFTGTMKNIHTGQLKVLAEQPRVTMIRFKVIENVNLTQKL